MTSSQQRDTHPSMEQAMIMFPVCGGQRSSVLILTEDAGKAQLLQFLTFLNSEHTWLSQAQSALLCVVGFVPEK